MAKSSSRRAICSLSIRFSVDALNHARLMPEHDALLRSLPHRLCKRCSPELQRRRVSAPAALRHGPTARPKGGVARPQSAPIEAGEQNGTLCQCPERGSRKRSSSHAPPAIIITSAPRNMKGRTPSTRTSSNPARASPTSSIGLANRKERVRRSILRAIRFVDVASDLPLRPFSSRTSSNCSIRH